MQFLLDAINNLRLKSHFYIHCTCNANPVFTSNSQTSRVTE